MSRPISYFACLLILLGATNGAQAQTAERGRALFQQCVVCHGQRAEGTAALKAPRLAGLPEWYVAQQLRNFRSGLRGAAEDDLYGAQMARMAEQLWDDVEVTAVAAYLGSLPPTPIESTVRGKASRGSAAFASCAACHGVAAEGNAELGAPPLRTLDDWYVVDQLNAFRVGARGLHASDLRGQQMRAAAGVLDDEQSIFDVAAYLVDSGDRRRSRRAASSQ